VSVRFPELSSATATEIRDLNLPGGTVVTVHHQTSFGIAFALTDCDIHTHARAPMNEFKNDVLLSYFKV
jgi:hypothetical protein